MAEKAKWQKIGELAVKQTKNNGKYLAGKAIDEKYELCVTKNAKREGGENNIDYILYKRMLEVQNG